MTELRMFGDAFAIVKVATYQPLIVKWYSGQEVAMLHNVLSDRYPRVAPPASLARFGGKNAPTALRFIWRRRPDPLPAEISFQSANGEEGRKKRLEKVVQPVLESAILRRMGLSTIDAKSSGMIAKISHYLLPEGRKDDYENHMNKLNTAISLIATDPGGFVEACAKADIPTYLPDDPQVALSPVGITHLYRQLYFDLEAGVGPIEQLFAVAPKEEVEVVQETVRRQMFEQTEETGTETTLESEEQSRSLDELSDQVSSSIKRDLSVAISGDVSGTVGVYNVGAHASADFSTSSDQSRTEVKKTTREINTRSAERIRKSYKLQVRTVSEVTERSNIRRLIRNEGDEPVNYALRRVVRKVRVKVQDVGPRLCWQVYVSRPGQGLALSKFVHFTEAQPISVPDFPPGSPPRPEGGKETGSQTSDIFVWHNPADGVNYWVFDVKVAVSGDRIPRTITIDSVSDASPGGKDAVSPGIDTRVFVKNPDGAPPDGSVVWRISLAPGTADMVTVQYTVFYDPSPTALSEWQSEVDALKAQITAKAREEEFERSKKPITARSRIRARPLLDMRKEERYEIMNRMISDLFASAGSSGVPSPLEVEYFHRYFEEASIFYYAHPSWWVPRYQGGGSGLGRPEYEVTEDSEPAPLGKSLGWLIQLDGDRRRNEFLNSPWVRVCVPIRPGFERDALEWLAKHIEGKMGFDLDPKRPIGKLLAEIETQRAAENKATTGPDYVTLDGEVAPSETDDAKAYPVINEFEVILPTDGFAYDKVTIAD